MRRQGFARAQLRVAAAGNQLLRLHEKLDLTDTAATKLHVVAFDRDLAVTSVDVDLLLHGMNVGERRVVEIFAPDERLQVG